MKKFSPKQEKTETKMKTWAEESADTADEEKLTERDTVTTKKKQKKCYLLPLMKSSFMEYR